MQLHIQSRKLVVWGAAEVTGISSPWVKRKTLKKKERLSYYIITANYHINLHFKHSSHGTKRKNNTFLVHKKCHFKKPLLGPALFPKLEHWNLRGVSLINTSSLPLEKLSHPSHAQAQSPATYIKHCFSNLPYWATPQL